LGLTGYPLGHSLSPKLHAAALQAVGLAGEYNVYPVAPEDPQGLADLLGRVRSGALHGLNVTIPHKQAVIPLLDELTTTARAIGAVNTIYFRDGRLMGDNTDAPGFLADLKKFIGTIREAPLQNALVLGAGGSARAVVYALAKDGWTVSVAARRVEQAQDIITGLDLPDSESRVSSIGYQASTLSSLLSSLSLIVNTTPLGMSPKIDVSPWPDALPLPQADVYDLVYNPRETLFVRQARAAGLRAQTGLGMLVEQAALAFEIWTGRVPPRDVMFEAAGVISVD
jgi:shikimate dehydrogenase